MSNNCFCTIITYNFLPWALALYDSIKEQDKSIKLYVLVADESNPKIPEEFYSSNIQLLTLEQLTHRPLAQVIMKKYEHKDKDRIRWAMKGELISLLMEQNEYNKVIYCDPDIQFFNDFSFMWKELEKHSMLITPHWLDINNFKKLHSMHRVGLFNAGFVAASKKGLPVLNWWSKVCSELCEDIPYHFHDDQGYLDLMPIYFPEVKIMRHKGCNVAYWNTELLTRSVKNKVAYVSDEEQTYPIIFYHFARSKFSHFLQGSDTCLFPYFERLNERLKKYGYPVDLIDKAKKQLNSPKPKPTWKQRLKETISKQVPYKIYIQKKIPLPTDNEH